MQCTLYNTAILLLFCSFHNNVLQILYSYASVEERFACSLFKAAQFSSVFQSASDLHVPS